MEDVLFPNFRKVTLATSGGEIALVTGGGGPPVLLLHGYPQTRAAWHKISPALAERFTVVIPDLRGYGESAASAPNQSDAFTKRALARDQKEIMAQLGYHKFAVVGHDRGARVGYRLALDSPECVVSLTSLNVIPTIDVWDQVNTAFASRAYHWFFLAQPFDLPEKLLASDPDYFLDRTLVAMSNGRDIYHPEALAAYRTAFRSSSVRHAMCEDYRAALGPDTEADAADRATDRRITCPVLVLWQDRPYPDASRHPISIWRKWVCGDVRGAPIEGASHMLPEDAPDAVLEQLLPFLEAHNGEELHQA